MAVEKVDVVNIYTGDSIGVYRTFWQRLWSSGKYATHVESMNYTSAVKSYKSQAALNDKPAEVGSEKPVEVKTGFFRGMRVTINESSGFSRGGLGTVVFVEYLGKRVWVHRDGSSSPCFFLPHELTLDESESPENPMPLKSLISDNCRFLFSKFMAGKFEGGFEIVVYRILDWASKQDLYKGDSDAS